MHLIISLSLILSKDHMKIAFLPLSSDAAKMGTKISSDVSKHDSNDQLMLACTFQTNDSMRLLLQ